MSDANESLLRWRYIENANHPEWQGVAHLAELQAVSAAHFVMDHRAKTKTWMTYYIIEHDIRRGFSAFIEGGDAANAKILAENATLVECFLACERHEAKG